MYFTSNEVLMDVLELAFNFVSTEVEKPRCLKPRPQHRRSAKTPPRRDDGFARRLRLPWELAPG